MGRDSIIFDGYDHLETVQTQSNLYNSIRKKSPSIVKNNNLDYDDSKLVTLKNSFENVNSLNDDE